MKKTLDSWSLTSNIIASSFDTPKTNTGVHAGGCPILQQHLGHQILWLCCRHHIPEIILKAAFQSLFGKTKGPVETLCQTLKSAWDTLDLSDLRFHHIPACYRSSTETLMEFVDERLHPENIDKLTRGDYKEFLELAKVCLGGSIERKKGYSYQLSRNGADHHARWMSKVLYILKLSLVQHQIASLNLQTKGKITKMSSFIIFVYTRYWFTSPSLCNAASNDLSLFKEITTFKRVDNKIYSSATTTLLRHTWYLTEENISLALFSTDIHEDGRNQLAMKIGKLPFAEVEMRKPTLLR